MSKLVKDLIWEVGQVGSAAPYLLLVGGEATYILIGGEATYLLKGGVAPYLLIGGVAPYVNMENLGMDGKYHWKSLKYGIYLKYHLKTTNISVTPGYKVLIFSIGVNIVLNYNQFSYGTMINVKFV